MRQDALYKGNFDAVDAIVAEWRRERPDLDPAAKHLTGRLVRVASLIQAAFAQAFAPLGLNEGDYGVLAALRRAGAPHQLTPSDLARHQMMTSGGMTAAIDRLERKGLVTRRPNPNDRRGTLVGLSDVGRKVVDRAMELQAEVETRLVQALDDSERSRLEQLLRKLLLSVDET
jgi:DNA-binding MarR family transcriptional regulator